MCPSLFTFVDRGLFLRKPITRIARISQCLPWLRKLEGAGLVIMRIMNKSIGVDDWMLGVTKRRVDDLSRCIKENVGAYFVE